MTATAFVSETVIELILCCLHLLRCNLPPGGHRSAFLHLPDRLIICVTNLRFNDCQIKTWACASPLSALQVVRILEKHEPRRSSVGALGFLSGHASSSSGPSRLGPIPADEASAVQNYVEHMLFLLMEEESGQGERMAKTLLDGVGFWGVDVSCVLFTRGSDGCHPGVCGSGGGDGEAVPVEPEETVH